MLLFLGADYSFVIMLFGLILFVLVCWLIVALIRWLNRH